MQDSARRFRIKRSLRLLSGMTMLVGSLVFLLLLLMDFSSGVLEEEKEEGEGECVGKGEVEWVVCFGLFDLYVRFLELADLVKNHLEGLFVGCSSVMGVGHRCYLFESCFIDASYLLSTIWGRDISAF